jgi:hypothetical protein
MKKISVIILTAVTIASFISVDTAFAGRVGKRQVKQQKRIHQGIASHELSAGEIRRLEREQRHIQRSKRRAFSDGELTAKERVRLERNQDRASRHIYRTKHNEIR